MQAYLNDSAVKAALIERLRAFPVEGRTGNILFWADGKASPVGAAIQSDDVALWSELYGLPGWLALAIDTLATSGPSVEALWNAAIAVLEAIEPGQDVTPVAYRLIADALDGDPESITALCRTPAIVDMARRVAALHRKALSGETVDASVWRQVRGDAVRMADAFEGEGLEALCARTVEAAASDPVRSRTPVSETLRLWGRAHVAKSGYPWSDADDARVRARLDELYQAEKPKHPEGTFINVFELLEAQSPEMSEELHERNRIDRAAVVRIWAVQRDRLIAAVHPAPPEARLISRADLFANPERAGMQISPDGQWLGWLANGGGVMNIWVAPREDMAAARQLTFDEKRGIGSFFWSYQSGLLLYSQDRDGDENWRLFGANAATSEVKGLTPAEAGVRASVAAVSRQLPDSILISLNARDPRFPDLHRLDLTSGEITLVQQNDGFARFIADDLYNVRLAIRPTGDGGADILKPEGEGWAAWITLGMEDVGLTGPAWFSADGGTLYFYDSRGRNTAALTAYDTQTWVQTLIAENALADIGGALTDPQTYRPLAYSVTYARHELHLLDETLRADVDFLNGADIGEWGLGSRTRDNTLWLVSAGSDVRPAALYLYDRAAKTLEKLYDLRPALLEAPLQKMHSVIIPSRDGLPMVSYLTLPHGGVSTPAPLVLLVHGGPWSRDGFGFNNMHQWLSNRGYGVLSVNFRASSGFGKAFLRAGDGEWGGRMDEDLEDAVQWVVEAGIADPKRLAIVGGSYGGYAVLSALTRYPERYACGIDIVGPSNLETLLASIPAYWEAERAMQYRAIGNPETEEGRAFLKDRSPLHRAAQIRAPLLIAQGGNDPRVRQAESEQMVEALKAHAIPVTYALFPDEGHGFVREANRMRFNALMEAFLARHLGGRYEDVAEGDFPGNSLILNDYDANDPSPTQAAQ